MQLMLSELFCWLLESIKIRLKDRFCDGFSDGICFDIEGKTFIKNAKRVQGSSRVLVHYTYHEVKIPNLKPFIQGMHVKST